MFEPWRRPLSRQIIDTAVQVGIGMREYTNSGLIRSGTFTRSTDAGPTQDAVEIRFEA
jgi:hypothetical protein